MTITHITPKEFQMQHRIDELERKAIVQDGILAANFWTISDLKNEVLAYSISLENAEAEKQRAIVWSEDLKREVLAYSITAENLDFLKAPE